MGDEGFEGHCSFSGLAMIFLIVQVLASFPGHGRP
jgi:hypothetical protein